MMRGKGRSEMKDDTILFNGDATKDPTTDDDDDDDDDRRSSSSRASS